MGLVLAGSHDRIRNLATNTAALWLLESGISVRRPEKNPYAIALDASGIALDKAGNAKVVFDKANLFARVLGVELGSVAAKRV